MIIRAEDDSDVAIDLTPIIDMVFLLLIFFLVATTFHQTERELQIALPASVAAGPISVSLREIVVNVDSEGRVVVSGRTISEADLAALVSQAVAENPEQKLTIRGDRSAQYAHIVRVLDICKHSGLREPYLDTVAAPAPP